MNVKKLPRAKYETILHCPECNWSGNNDEMVGASLHEMIEEHETEHGGKYLHCTCCGCDFRE